MLKMAPFAQISLPPNLDGSVGTNRAPRSSCQIPASNDKEAMACFLREYERSPGTERVYRREVERLLLWAVIALEKPVSSLSRQDLEQFLQFLPNPTPHELWCGPKTSRGSEHWRPFVGGLRQDAMLTAIAAINSLFRWLVDACYLQANPMGLVRQRRKKVGDFGASASERHLDAVAWDAAMRAVEAMEGSAESAPLEARADYERSRFLLMFLYLLAPRAGELETHTMNSFVVVRSSWWWQVTGKGQKDARLPVPDDMVAALTRYRRFLGLPAVPSHKEDLPLFLAIRDMLRCHQSGTDAMLRPLTARQLNRVLKREFSRAAGLLPADSEIQREKLLAASAHWGRHTSITAKVDAGIGLRFVQKDARHSDPRTTGLYVHEVDEQWQQEAQKLQLPWPAKSR